MVLSELEKLLAYINLYHNPERSATLCEIPSGYTRKLVVDIDCKMILRKNWLPASRVTVITIRTDNGEEKFFDVSDISWYKDKRLLDIKLWLIGAEPGDWYGLTCADSERKCKFFKQIMAFRKMRPDCDVDGAIFTKDFLNSFSSDPFYMSDNEMYRQLERVIR